MQLAIEKLGDEVSCAVERDGVIIAEGKGNGVKPLLGFIDGGIDIGGAELADTVIGKAAAMLCVKLGLRSVYGKVMSESGYILLRANEIDASYGKLVPYIKNRTGDGMCPLETSVVDVDDVAAGEQKIRETVKKLMAKKNS